MKKLTYDFVKKQFELHGCILLEKEYFNNFTPMQFICVCGDQSVITWASFRLGSRCVACGMVKSLAKKRLSDPHAEFEKQGCKLVGHYVNNYTPVQYICSCGNESKIRLFALQKGQRCRSCNKNKGENHYKWNPNRDAVELLKVLQRRSRHLLLYSLKKTGQKKTYKKAYMLGYSPAQLRSHLESFPDWTTLKLSEWHIDHIFPVKAFVDHGIQDIKLINCLENLRPVSASFNLKKNSSYDEQDFLIWLSLMSNKV